jgi:lipopolysaccharide/colanic/teichoic acid biosynthesis glycosyltransferase
MMRRAARPLLYAGVVGIVLGLAKVHASFIGHYPFTSTSRFAWSLLYALILATLSYGAGLPDLPRRPRAAATSAALAAGGGALLISVLQLAAGSALLPRFVTFGAAAAVVPWAFACVGLAHGGRASAELRDRVFVVAEPEEAAALVAELAQTPERPAVLVDHVSAVEGHPRGPRSRPLVERVLESSANLVVLDRTAQGDAVVVSQAAALHEHGIRVRTLSMFYEDWLGKMPVSELERVSLFFDIGEVHLSRYPRFKRSADVAFSLVASVAVVVAVPIVAVANLAGNRGPLLFRQERVGKNGRLFTIYKFRTMTTVHGIEDGSWTTAGDPRITRVGGMLRRTHLDELPQVLNILRGDLSLVGPRPEQRAYVEQLVQKLPFYDLRHLVRPGLTGWAQVKYGYAGNEHDAMEKLQYEFWYLRHQSLLVDLRIVGRTLRSVLGSQSAGR